MGEAQGEAQGFALLGYTVPNALDFQVFGIPFRNTDDHIVDQGTGQAVEAAVHLVVGRTGHGDHPIIQGHGQFFADLTAQFAFRSLNGDQVIFHRYRNFIRDGNRSFSNS